MSGSSNNQHKFKISQLAKKSDVTVSTIKYYLKEGLIPSPVKGNGSMSFYSQEHVDRILQIKKLQKDQFFPLNVIKKMLNTEPFPDLPVAKDSRQNSSWEVNQSTDMITLADVVREMGLNEKELEQIEKAGFVHSSQTFQGKTFDALDLEILKLFKSRRDTGLPLEHTLDVFGVYQKFIIQAVNEDIHLCLNNFIEKKEGADFINYITEGEKTATEFLSLCKIKYTRFRVNDVIRKHETIPIRVVEALSFRNLESFVRLKNQEKAHLEFVLPLELVFQKSPLNSAKEMDRPSLAETHADNQALCLGILDIIEGENQNSQVKFKRILKDSDFAPLSYALSGLSHTIQISRISSMIHFIGEMRKIVDFIERSKQISKNVMVNLFTSYCRLVCYSVRPNFFDVKKKAGREFDDLTSRINQIDAQPEYIEFKDYLSELTFKSCYFMVFMYQDRELYSEAISVLDRMLKRSTDIFYSSWAHRKKIELSELL